MGELTRGLRVDIDHDRCVCSMTCVAIAPDVFGVEDYETKVLVTDIPEELRDLMKEAEEMCPSGAISLVEPAEGTS